MIKLNKIIASSIFPGLGNNQDIDIVLPITSQTIAADSQVLYTISKPLLRSDAIANIRVYVNGLDAPQWWHVVAGIQYGFPNHPIGSFPNFFCQISHTREANQITINAIYRNPVLAGGASRVLPAHSILIKARLFVAPFK